MPNLVSLNVCLPSSHRSQCHLGEPVSHGLLRDGGLGLPQDPAASLHRPHGGASVPAATAPRWRDLHQGETDRETPPNAGKRPARWLHVNVCL